MAKMRVLSAFALAGAMAATLSACGGAGGEKVHERVASPDEKTEAVVMTCPMDGDAKVLLVTGAVFEKKGQGCADLTSALGSVRVSTPQDGEGDEAVSVAWQDGKAVFTFEGDRTVVSREAKAGAPLDIIAVRGDFEEADIPLTN